MIPRVRFDAGVRAPLLALVFTVVLAPCGRAQTIPRSQLAGVSQNLAGTQIDIVYRRPSARGRELFGALVPWDRVWSPSADSAARFTITAPIEVNGAPLAAGSYSIWAIPGATEWTMIFSTVPSVFHTRYPTGQDAARVKAAPEAASSLETLSFYFASADGDSATLRLHWGTTAVPVKIRARRP
ncbi:MAG: DUF2911 domain-containing protein [Gemmatimonadota bacterium]|nr:DUF2911 domain-containing protein [Gemmatimonadota bacterium]